MMTRSPSVRSSDRAHPCDQDALLEELAAGGLLPRADESAAPALFQRRYTDCNGRHGSMYPGVLNGLADMRESGHALACVTNKLHPCAVALLAAKDFSPYLDALVCAGDAMPAKPYPASRCCMPAWVLGVDPSDAVMIGDSEVDTTSTSCADMPIYLVRYGYHRENGFTMLRCNGFLNAIGELPRLLASARNAG